MKILITGAAGFIGSHLAKYCLEKGHYVIGIDKERQSTKFLELEKYDDIVYRTDTFDIAIGRNTDYINDLFEALKPDVCYHLAAYASEGRSNHIRSFIHQNNTVGTANVINACVNHKCKLVFTSSVAVYSGSPPFTETMTPRPIDEYGLSKYMSERSIQIAGDTQGLDYCIIRPRNVYGPGQNMWDRSRNLFGIWCYNALHDLPLIVFGDGGNMRNFTYIDDMIPCLYNGKNVSSEVINLGSSVGYSIQEAVDAFVAVTGYNNVQYTEARHEVETAVCNVSKSERLLDWNLYGTTTRLKDGIDAMWEWAKQQPERPLQSMPPLEVTVNAHSSLKS